MARVDITGTIYGRHRMGYLNERQISRGLHTRLFARAFVAEDPQGNAVAFAIADLGMVFKAMRQSALRKITERTKGAIRDENFMLAATHTHSASAGLSHNHMFNLFYGFDPQDFSSTADGIADAVVAAWENRVRGSMAYAEGTLSGLSVNRSAVAQGLDSDVEGPVTDQIFKQINFTSADGEPIGAFNWFPIHGTSLGKENVFISGDNKGIAARMLERRFHPGSLLPKFVAGFANSNEGDASPFPNHWSKEGTNLDDLALVRLHGERQAARAWDLWEGGGEAIPATASSRIWWVRVPEYSFNRAGGDRVSLCTPALGYSMFAGAEDGPGELPGFFEGMREGVPVHLGLKARGAELAVHHILLQKPGRAASLCHAPKPVLADFSGKSSNFAPYVMPFQLMRIGTIALVGVPNEVTTVAGRRLLASLKPMLDEGGISHPILVGLANDYSGYMTTREEYQSQHYEGASTYYGPNQLDGFISIFRQLAGDILGKGTLSAADFAMGRAALEQELLANEVSIATVGKRWKLDLTRNYRLYPSPVSANAMAKVLKNVKPTYRLGEIAEFIVSSPSPNVLSRGISLLRVERLEGGAWQGFASEEDGEATIYWNLRRDCPACGQEVIRWRIPTGAPAGTYRISVHLAWGEPRSEGHYFDREIQSQEFQVEVLR